MKIRSLAAWSCLTAAMAFGVAACGDDDTGSGGGGGSSSDSGGGSLTVYSSLPLQGASRPQSEDVIKGIQLALKQKGNKCGDFTIKYESLDDATAAAGKWEPGATSANARKVAQDDSAIAYIGEFNSGASAISIPINNEAGILQVSPSNTALGLTKEGAGATPGEPEKYYPTGERNYGRVVPIDTIQGAAQAQYMKDEGVTSVYILDDAEVYGKGVATNTKDAAEKLGIEIAGEDSWDGKASNYRALASKIKSQRRRRRLHRRHHRQQRAAAVQGPPRGDAGREAVRPRRRRDRGLHQGDPRRRAGADVPDGADAVAGRAAAGRSAVLQGLRGRVRRAAGRDRPVRRVRLRGDGRRLRLDRARVATTARR